MVDIDDLNGLSNDDYSQIGRAVVEAVVLEQLVDLLMRTCVGDTWVSDIFTAGSNWGWRYERARMLVNGIVPDEPVRERALFWLDGVNDAHERRGRIVHSHWIPSADSVSGSRMQRGNAKEHVPLRHAKVTLEDVSMLVTDMHRLRGQFLPVLDEVRASVQSGRARGLILPRSEMKKRQNTRKRQRD